MSAGATSQRGHGGRVHDHRRNRQAARPKPKTRGLPATHVNFEELGLRIAAAPSRAKMVRPMPKTDYLEHCWKFYNRLWEWGHAVGSGHYDATWNQLIVASKFPDQAKVRESLRRYALVLEEIGVAKVYGVKDANGAWQRLDVELLEPPDVDASTLISRLPRRSSSVGFSNCHSGRRHSHWSKRELTRRVRKRINAREIARAGRAGRNAFPRLSRRNSNLRHPERAGQEQALDLSRECGPGRALAHEPQLVGGTRATAVSPATPGAPGEVHEAEQPVGDVTSTLAAAPTGKTAASRELGPAVRLFRVAVAHGWDDPSGKAGWAAAVDAAVAERRASGDQRPAGEHASELIEALWWAIRGGEPKADAWRLEQLRRGAAMVERYALFGTGDAAAAVELAGRRIADEALARGAEEAEPRLRSLGGVAVWLYAVGRKWRRSARVRAGELPPRQIDGKPMLPPRPKGWTWPDWY